MDGAETRTEGGVTYVNARRAGGEPVWVPVPPGMKPYAAGRAAVPVGGVPPTTFPRTVRPATPHPGAVGFFAGGGPGSELKAMLESLSFRPAEGCGCSDLAATMDKGGVVWCREHRAEIVEHLRIQRERTGWLRQFTAAVRAVANGLAFELDPADPCGSLVDEAVRRAEAKLAGPIPPVVTIDRGRLAGDGFNCSLVRHAGRLVFAYRVGWAGSEIFACPLGPDLQPSAPSVLLNRLYHPRANYGREDPRLFVFAGKLHVAYVGVEVRGGKLWTNQLYARLADDFAVEEVFAPPAPDPGRWQKNWSFFEHGGELYAVYTVRPHVVLRIDGDRVAETFTTDDPLPWSGGLLRGGAPPVRVGDEYLHFFHGKVPAGPGWPTHRYNVGVYAFEARPPFRVLRQTADPIDWPDPATRPADQYCDCLFPGGAVRDGGVWRVACGVHDRWAEVRTYDAAAVEKALGVGRPAWWSDRPGTIDPNVFRDVAERDEYRLGPGPLSGVAVDVGGHVGSFAFAAWSRGLAVHSYEPDPANRDYLLRNAAHMVGVTVYPEPVGHPDSPDLFLHAVPGAHNTGGSACTADDRTEYPGETAVPVGKPLPLDDAILRAAAASPTGRVAALKIDAEGAEWPALAGATRLDLVDRVAGEWHVNPRFAWAGKVWTPADLAGLLEPHGFWVAVPDSPTAPTHGPFFADRPPA